MSTPRRKEESLTVFGRQGHITVTVSRDYEPGRLVTDNGQREHERAMSDVVGEVNNLVGLDAQ